MAGDLDWDDVMEMIRKVIVKNAYDALKEEGAAEERTTSEVYDGVMSEIHMLLDCIDSYIDVVAIVDCVETMLKEDEE